MCAVCVPLHDFVLPDLKSLSFNRCFFLPSDFLVKIFWSSSVLGVLVCEPGLRSVHQSSRFVFCRTASFGPCWYSIFGAAWGGLVLLLVSFRFSHPGLGFGFAPSVSASSEGRSAPRDFSRVVISRSRAPGRFSSSRMRSHPWSSIFGRAERVARVFPQGSTAQSHVRFARRLCLAIFVSAAHVVCSVSPKFVFCHRCRSFFKVQFCFAVAELRRCCCFTARRRFHCLKLILAA
jgi:hypothetical protein